MVLRKDYPYLLLAAIVSALVATVVSNPGESVGTFALLGLIGIGIVMAIIVNPSLGANILIIAVFSNISAKLTEDGLPGVIKPLVAVVFGAIIIRNFYVGQIPMNRPKTKYIEISLILYLFATVGSYLVADDKYTAQELLIDLVKDTIIMYCILFSLRKIEEWKRAVFLLILVVSFSSLLGTYQVATGNFSENFFGLSYVRIDRVSGPVNEPNMWAQVLVAVMPLAIFRFLNAKANQKILYGALLTFMFITFLNTYSRGGYVAFFIAVFAITFFFTRFNLVFVSSVIAIAVLTLPLLPAAYKDRFLSLTSFTSGDESKLYEDHSFRGRTSEMVAGLAMFADYPILGLGLGNYNNYYLEYSQAIGLEFRAEARDAHSLYTEMLAERGILGFLSFTGIISFLFMGLANAKRDLRATKYFDDLSPHISAMQVAFIAYLIAAIFLHDAFIRYLWIFVALAMALIQIVYELIGNQIYSQNQEAIV